MDSISARFQPSVRIGNWVEENCLEEVEYKKQIIAKLYLSPHL